MYNDDEPRYIVYENHGEIQRNGVLILDDGFEDGFEPKWEEGFFTLADALNEIKKRTDLYEQLYLESEK